MNQSITTKNFKMNVMPGDRTGGHLSRVNTWRFEIKTGDRCSGMASSKSYATSKKAFNAGERMLNLLSGVSK